MKNEYYNQAKNGLLLLSPLITAFLTVSTGAQETLNVGQSLTTCLNINTPIAESNFPDIIPSSLVPAIKNYCVDKVITNSSPNTVVSVGTAKINFTYLVPDDKKLEEYVNNKVLKQLTATNINRYLANSLDYAMNFGKDKTKLNKSQKVFFEKYNTLILEIRRQLRVYSESAKQMNNNGTNSMFVYTGSVKTNLYTKLTGNITLAQNNFKSITPRINADTIISAYPTPILNTPNAKFSGDNINYRISEHYSLDDLLSNGYISKADYDKIVKSNAKLADCNANLALVNLAQGYTDGVIYSSMALASSTNGSMPPSLLKKYSTDNSFKSVLNILSKAYFNEVRAPKLATICK
jgi:hypothetical protein